jgi:hypothetical protein
MSVSGVSTAISFRNAYQGYKRTINMFNRRKDKEKVVRELEANIHKMKAGCTRNGVSLAIKDIKKVTGIF